MLRMSYIYPNKDNHIPIMEAIGRHKTQQAQSNSQAVDTALDQMPMSKKTKAELKRLQNRGIGIEQIRDALKNNSNPLKNSRKPIHLHTSFEWILRHGGFKKTDLRDEFMKRGMTTSSASSLVSSVVSILEVTGLFEITRSHVKRKEQPHE